MGLETGTYLNDLVTTNPDGATDAKSEGDNHIRLVKSTLKATFPGMAGAAWRVQTKAADYTLAATDNMSQINVTAAATITGVAATLGNQFAVIIYNAHSAAITIPSSTLPVGSAVLMTCNGSGYHHFQFAMGNPTVTSLTTTGSLTSGGELKCVNSTAERVLRLGSSNAYFFGNANNIGLSGPTSGAQIVLAVADAGTGREISMNGGVTVTKSDQTTYATAAIESQAATGDAGISLHCVGASAVFLKNPRGTNACEVYNSSGALGDFRANQVNVGSGANTYFLAGTNPTLNLSPDVYFQSNPNDTYLTFDTADYFRYEQTSDTLTFYRNNVGKITMSDSGIYGTADNAVACGVPTNRWTVVYAVNGTIQTSDKREKDHITGLADCGDIIDALQPVRFSWKQDGRVDLGFYAQDVSPLVPEAVREPKTDDERWGFQPDRLIPLLVAEIQSLRARVAALESR